jgi:phospholipase C
LIVLICENRSFDNVFGTYLPKKGTTANLLSKRIVTAAEVHRGQLGAEPVDGRSRDNFPNPVTAAGDPYLPTNSPAIGDLMDMFDFHK